MLANDAARILIRTLKQPSGELTIADASAKSGLSLRDAEVGLHFLVADYRGHLSATQKGDLLFRFPTGFSKPWEKIEAFDAAFNKIKNFVLGVAKFIVRAWISVVMVAYVAIFALIIIGLSFAKSSDRDDRGSFGGTLLLHTLMRVILDSLFWTFHPFSPFYAEQRDPYGYGRRSKKNDVPFYEQVNRFFFGPPKVRQDPMETQRVVLQEIRARKGRIGLADVMRVSGLGRDRADSLLARLMLDYEGEVKVSDQGGIVYLFPEIRKTVQDEDPIEPMPIWTRKEQVFPLTGNTPGSNLLIGGLNGFNWLMSVVAISGSWTLEKLHWMFSAGASANQWGFTTPEPIGTPLLLGWIPFWFSTALFALPLIRLWRKGGEKRRVARENGRRGLLWAILNKLTPRGIREETLRSAWQSTAGVVPSESELVKEVVKLGGELEVEESGATLYRFRDLEAEANALVQERSNARESEKDVGEVVFSSAR